MNPLFILPQLSDIVSRFCLVGGCVSEVAVVGFQNGRGICGIGRSALPVSNQHDLRSAKKLCEVPQSSVVARKGCHRVNTAIDKALAANCC